MFQQGDSWRNRLRFRALGQVLHGPHLGGHHLDGFFTIRGLADYGEIGSAFEQLHQSFTDNFVVIRYNDSGHSYPPVMIVFVVDQRQKG